MQTRTFGVVDANPYPWPFDAAVDPSRLRPVG